MSCCGVVGAIGSLWCKSGCKTAVVASALTFFPPPPSYDVREVDGVWVCEYDPMITPPGPDEEVIVSMVRTRRGNDIPLFHFLCPGAHFTLIHSHGNATDCGAMADRYREMVRELGVNVIGYDYSGYGSATGQPSEADTYADIEAAYDYACEHVDDPGRQIVLYGQSVGTGPTIRQAGRKPVGGAVLHAGIMSGMRVLTASRALGCLDIYPNTDRVRRVGCPVFVMHGLEDEEVGVDHGHGLYSALPPEYQFEPWWVENCGHNDIGEDHATHMEYYQRLLAFLQELERFHIDRKAASMAGEMASPV